MIDTLLQRNSHARLTDPGPGEDDLQTILAAGLRAPDHGRLRPWRFVLIAGDRRADLGQVFEQSLLSANPEATHAERDKARNALLRAPVVIAGLVCPVEHPKIPRSEQLAAVACALYGMQLSADCLGFGSVWRTGHYARDAHVLEALGGSADQEVVGFLYIGTRQGEPKPLVRESLAEHIDYY